MTDNNSFKKQIRARMKLTGETYTQARAHLYDPSRKSDSFYLNAGYRLNNALPRSELRMGDLFTDSDSSALMQIVDRNNGLVVIAGATATGKTLTMNSILNSYPEDRRLVSIEVGNRQLELPPTKLHLSLLLPTLSGFDNIVLNVLRMRAWCITFPENISSSEEALQTMVGVVSTGYLGLMELHSLSLAQTIDNLKESFRGDFTYLQAVVMQKRFTFNERTFFKSSVIVFTDEVRHIAKEYAESGDEARFYAQLEEQGITAK